GRRCGEREAGGGAAGDAPVHGVVVCWRQLQMEDAPLSRARRVTDAKAAAVFAQPRRARLLLAFAARERSLVEVAAELGIALNLAHYHVRRMVALGLLQPTRARARRGRPQQLYRAAST